MKLSFLKYVHPRAFINQINIRHSKTILKNSMDSVHLWMMGMERIVWMPNKSNMNQNKTNKKWFCWAPFSQSHSKHLKLICTDLFFSFLQFFEWLALFRQMYKAKNLAFVSECSGVHEPLVSFYCPRAI